MNQGKASSSMMATPARTCRQSRARLPGTSFTNASITSMGSRAGGPLVRNAAAKATHISHHARIEAEGGPKRHSMNATTASVCIAVRMKSVVTNWPANCGISIVM